MNTTITFTDINYNIDILDILKIIILTIIMISDSELLLEFVIQTCTKYFILVASLYLIIFGLMILHFNLFMGILSMFFSGALFTIFMILNRI